MKNKVTRFLTGTLVWRDENGGNHATEYHLGLEEGEHEIDTLSEHIKDMISNRKPFLESLISLTLHQVKV